MDKELKAFENIMKIYGKTNSLEGTYDDFLTIKKALQRLEQIENAKPSEALKCLENLCDEFPILKKDYKIIKQELFKAQEQEKVLEIIKEKEVEMALFNDSKTVEDYNRNRNWGAKELTKEEFILLKRYLCQNE